VSTEIASWLYRIALRNSKKVFFQNNDDLNLFVEKKLIKKELSERIPGSGVDTQRFSPMFIDRPKQRFVFLLVARMLWDKGVGELVEAMRILKDKYGQVECQLLGFLEVDNPSAIRQSEMQHWVEQGLVTYLGVSVDVVKFLHDADCVVLPSYREGLPRSLLEAASVGKPIITTNTVGCRDVVDDGINGYVCKVGESQDLADKMERMIKLPRDARIRMGKRGREKMLREFDERIVIGRYLTVIKSLL
jgi:glycosyltransferase involved in cell wall biosynthesis